jgi:hypothetical protein
VLKIKICSCLLFTELAKYTIGRLRPHFLVVCNPELTDALCKENGYMKFVELDNEELVCRGMQLIFVLKAGDWPNHLILVPVLNLHQAGHRS